MQTPTFARAESSSAGRSEQSYSDAIDAQEAREEEAADTISRANTNALAELVFEHADGAPMDALFVAIRDHWLTLPGPVAAAWGSVTERIVAGLCGAAK